VAFSAIQIGGVVPFTTVDYPGRMAAVLFCQGCPWRCAYCHNPHLQRFGKGASEWSWPKTMDFLREREGFLEAVVFSGGEPTAQVGLKEALQEVKALGYLTGLHTAGNYPERLEEVLPWVDWVGLDLKMPLNRKYEELTGQPGSSARVMQSWKRIEHSGVACQLRTTVHPKLHSAEDLDLIRITAQTWGAGEVVWQTCREREADACAVRDS
jgi:pyruvate formate lyase activating enzyme